jgi:putative transposase
MYDFRRMTPAERREILHQRWARGLPLHAAPHFRGVSGEYLITAACYEHRHIFDTPKALSYFTNEVLKAFHEVVHSRVAAAMNFQQGEKGRKVWYRYSDRLIRSERHHWASVNYVHYNPVKHGYVKKATDWPWVSVHEYLEAHGREWLAQTWTAYSLKDYGQGWDD